MRRTILKLVLTVLVLSTSMNVSALVLQVDGTGQLTGATGVEVNGILYDVVFLQGTCINLYSGCVDSDDFTFKTVEDAEAASQALLDTVLLDSVEYQFDSDPTTTISCSFEEHCLFGTPYGVDNDWVLIGFAINRIPDAGGDGVGNGIIKGRDRDTTGYSDGVWAIWSVANGPDQDGDGVPDDIDNCTNVDNADQNDADADGHGNRCDADFDNNCFTNFSDLLVMKAGFFTINPLLDLNGSGGLVNFSDLTIMKELFFLPPGQGLAGSLCNL